MEMVNVKTSLLSNYELSARARPYSVTHVTLITPLLIPQSQQQTKHSIAVICNVYIAVWLKQTHLSVFIEEWCQCSLEVTITLQHYVAADGITVVEVILLSHASVESIRQQAAGQLQLLMRDYSIIRDDFKQQTVAIIRHSLYGCVRNTDTHRRIHHHHAPHTPPQCLYDVYMSIWLLTYIASRVVNEKSK